MTRVLKRTLVQITDPLEGPETSVLISDPPPPPGPEISFPEAYPQVTYLGGFRIVDRVFLTLPPVNRDLFPVGGLRGTNASVDASAT